MSRWHCGVCGRIMIGEPGLNGTCWQCQCWAEGVVEKLAWRRLGWLLDEVAHKPVNEWR